MIPAATLTAMRNAANKTLDQTCTVQRDTPTGSDGYGQQSLTWPTAPGGNNAPVRLAPPTLQQQQQYAAYIGTQQAFVLSFKQTQDVKQKDRVVVAGMTLSVQVPRIGKSNQILLQVLATRVS